MNIKKIPITLTLLSFVFMHQAFSLNDSAGKKKLVDKSNSGLMANKKSNDRITNWDPSLRVEKIPAPAQRSQERVAKAKEQKAIKNNVAKTKLRAEETLAASRSNMNEKRQQANSDQLSQISPAPAMQDIQDVADADNKQARPARPEEDPFWNRTNAEAVYNTEKNLLVQMHAINLMQIHIGELAAQKNASPKVKAFGRRLVMDHAFADDQILKLAKKQGLVLADNPTATEQQAIRMLEALDGNEFNQAFLDQMAVDHQTTVLLLNSAMGDLPGRSYVRVVIDRLIPIFGQHYEVSQVLKYK